MKQAFSLPPLPWAIDSLKIFSKETIEFHYGKHHAGYVNKLNAIAQTNPQIAKSSLEDLIKNESGKVFNLAAQVWNHTFFWHCLSPNGGGVPEGPLQERINHDFGSFDKFKAKFDEEGINHFGSGWVWLVKNQESGKLEVLSTHDADNPLKDGKKPLLTCDVWEHAYYIDYRNSRENYMKEFWGSVNWPFVSSQ